MSKAVCLATLAAISLLLAIGCSASAAREGDEKELVVFAASSLTEVFHDMAAAFNLEHPEVMVTFNFAGSQRLRTQLEHGAQADVFASADWHQMNGIVDAGLAARTPTSFAANRLTVIVSSHNTQISSLKDLATPGMKLVLALPDVPVGGYSRAALKNLSGDSQLGPDYATRVLANVVSEETNVRSVTQKVALGEADAGIVYQSDALTPDIAERVRAIPIPDQSNVVASYPIAALKASEQPDLAQRFIEFTMSDEGQRVLARHGFSPVKAVDTTGEELPVTGANGQ